MYLSMDEGLSLSLPQLELMDTKKNLSELFSTARSGFGGLELDASGEVLAEPDPDYEQFLADVWVGIVLTLMVLSCVCCMCSCLLYHKFQQWKRTVIESRNASNLESGSVETELPSYTIASGLPTYQEALEQLKQVKELTTPHQNPSAKGQPDGGGNTADNWVPHTPPSPMSVINVFQLYKNQQQTSSSTPVSNKPA